jgi:hypothetical protein
LLVDDYHALVGTLAPAESCQAVTGTNPALAAAARAYFRAPALALAPPSAPAIPGADDTARLGWLAWESRKQRRLLGLPDNEAA